MASEKHFFKKLASNIDWLLLLSVAVLVSIGFLAIYAATDNATASSRFVPVQTFALTIGIGIMLFVTLFNYQHYEHLDKMLYIVSLVMLIAVLIFGSTVRGTRGWFNLGFASFQPVEVAKIIYILVLASFLNKKAKESRKFSFLAGAFLILMGHLSLIMMQPDFSSSIAYFPVTLVLMFMAGVEPFYLFSIVVFGGLAVGIPLFRTFLTLQYGSLQGDNLISQIFILLARGGTWIYLVIIMTVLLIVIWWFLKKLRIRVSMMYPVILCISIILGCIAAVPVEKSLKDYQRKRLIVFLNPKLDSRGSGYNIIQSKIAIGSGKITGKGFKKGTQTQLGFLPEQHTDFIFAVVAEEGGWVFSQLTLLFYFLFIWRALVIARESRDSYGSLVAVGLATMFTFYAFINVGMVMGMMPVTGMPLLLLSYGGSSLVTSLFAVGILMSIHMRRHTYYKE